MAQNLYIAASESDTGKSLVILGIMDILSRQVKKVGFFRPIVQNGQHQDEDVRLISARYNLNFDYKEMYGLTSDEAFDFIQSNDMDSLYTGILNKFKALEKKCDFVLCEGTDYTGTLKPFEFDFNVRVANHLGAMVMALVNGNDKSVTEIIDSMQLVRNILIREKSTYMGVFINRAKISDIESIKQSYEKHLKPEEMAFVIPEKDILQKLTMRQIAQSLDAKHIYGDDDVLNHDVLDFRIGAMSMEHIMKYITDGVLVITSGDRAEVLLGLFMTLIAENFPKIAGIILTGGYPTNPEVMRVINGVKRIPVAVYSVDEDTYTTAMKVSNIKPKLAPDNERRLATALGLFEDYVDSKKLLQKISITRSGVVTPIMFEYQLFERARKSRKHIVLPEGTDERILRATEILLKRNVVDITLLGNEDEIYQKSASLQISLKGAHIIDPYDNDLINEYAPTYYHLRKHKGITRDTAFDLMHDVSYFGTMMVYKGHADGMVSGAAHTTQHTIRPAFEFIRTKPGVSIVSSSFFMCLEDRVLVYGDCAVNPNPDSRQLADIAISSAETSSMFGIEPRIAMLSYSTGDSGKGVDVEKVREATKIAREKRPDLSIEGPIQYDAAIDASVAMKKMPDSKVAGKATIFIFPDLNTGNNTYKAVQRAANAVAIGPVLQGLNKPVNDLSRGCTVKDIVNTVIITAIQSQAE